MCAGLACGRGTGWEYEGPGPAGRERPPHTRSAAPPPPAPRTPRKPPILAAAPR